MAIRNKAGGTLRPRDGSVGEMGMDSRHDRARSALLELPLDILRCIIKEVTHTNDLIALTLTHSALHALAVPHLYSRFDIVWPDVTTHLEPRSGVDALTYGLATLVMSEDVFHDSRRTAGNDGTGKDRESSRFTCEKCGHQNRPARRHAGRHRSQPRKRRRGNNYAQYVKKFSLGNGPPESVQEYMITREGGKMLGTLVALSIARMKNLEVFIWDMPTGLLQDVWQSLASLGEGRDGRECRLEKVWIRWHDNSLISTLAAFPPAMLAGPPLPNIHFNTPSNNAGPPMAATTGNNLLTILGNANRADRETFSKLPPLKSLNVLDIDELAYLDEMSVLVGKSRGKLRELRVGIARYAEDREWVGAWEAAALQQLANTGTKTASGISQKRLGGVLGVLVGHVYNIRQRRRRLSFKDPFTSVATTDQTSGHQGDINGFGASSRPASQDETSNSGSSESYVRHAPTSRPSSRDDNVLHQPLAIEVLELERVPLSLAALAGAFDWTRITQLTLLDCAHHETLFKALRRRFAPKPMAVPTKVNLENPLLASASPSSAYPLQIRKIHVNTVTSSLIHFLRDALAPNMLEVLVLHQSADFTSRVSIEAIFKVIRYHSRNMQQLYIESSDRNSDGMMPVGWRKWMFSREMLQFVASGRMPNLKELGMAIDSRDWHFLLQNLPSVPHLYSLYLPFIGKNATAALAIPREPPQYMPGFFAAGNAGLPHPPPPPPPPPPVPAPMLHQNNMQAGNAPASANTSSFSLETRELAMQILDIVTLCPEVELTYVGIAHKCFEILEADGKGGKELEDDIDAFGSYYVGLPAEELDDAASDDNAEEETGELDLGGDRSRAAFYGGRGYGGARRRPAYAGGVGAGAGTDSDATEEDESDDSEVESNWDSEESDEEWRTGGGQGGESNAHKLKRRFRVREILFYDDKVAVFKARHGRL